jgi:hypothetical protein
MGGPEIGGLFPEVKLFGIVGPLSCCFKTGAAFLFGYSILKSSHRIEAEKGGCSMNRGILQKTLLIFLLVFFGILQYSYAGTVPTIINYQGTLTDTSGNPVPNGQYGVVFSIYDVSTGGTALWTETWNSGTTPITTIGGDFGVLLGTHNPIPASFFADHPLTYLGIKVGSDSEMTPRQKIASVGYAFKAEYGVPKGAIIMWSGAIDQIPEGWALCDGVERTLPDGSKITPPNLKDKFILGASETSLVGNSGGNETVNSPHTHLINSEAPNTATTGNHQHLLGIDWDNNSVYYREPNNGGPYGSVVLPGYRSNNGSNSQSNNSYREGYSSSNGNHFHTTNAHSHGGSTQSGGAGLNIMPPYYALAFIMKL